MYTTNAKWLSCSTSHNVHHQHRMVIMISKPQCTPHHQLRMVISKPHCTPSPTNAYQTATMYTTNAKWLSWSANHNVHHQHGMVISKPQCTPPAPSGYQRSTMTRMYKTIMHTTRAEWTSLQSTMYLCYNVQHNPTLYITRSQCSSRNQNVYYHVLIWIIWAQ